MAPFDRSPNQYACVPHTLFTASSISLVGSAMPCGIGNFMYLQEWTGDRHHRAPPGERIMEPYAVTSTFWYIGVRHSACLSVVPRTTCR